MSYQALKIEESCAYCYNLCLLLRKLVWKAIFDSNYMTFWKKAAILFQAYNQKKLLYMKQYIFKIFIFSIISKMCRSKNEQI